MSSLLVTERIVDRKIASAISAIPPASGGSGYLVKTEITLTNTQIKTLPTTFIQIVAAPGANKAILFDSALITAAITTPYTNVDSSGNLKFEIGTSLSNPASVRHGIEPITFAGNYCMYFQPVNYADPSGFQYGRYASKTEANNKALNLKFDNVGSGNFTGGNAANTFKITVYYKVVDL